MKLKRVKITDYPDKVNPSSGNTPELDNAIGEINAIYRRNRLGDLSSHPGGFKRGESVNFGAGFYRGNKTRLTADFTHNAVVGIETTLAEAMDKFRKTKK